MNRIDTHHAPDSPEPIFAESWEADAAFEDSQSRAERVAQRAYELYLARGMDDGADLDDWLEAERQIEAELGRMA